jgi:DNA-binding response OmpR family regulator
LKNQTQPGLRILLVEDQQALACNIIDYLTSAGHQLDYAATGALALQLAKQHSYDVVLLDLMLPDIDGRQLCAQLRQLWLKTVPVLMLTALDSLDDKLQGFAAGADDYLTKPFELAELAVRCLALSRRHLLSVDPLLQLGPLVIDRSQQHASRSGLPLDLHPLGYRILVVLAEAYPALVSRSDLSYQLWGDEPPDSDALRAHIYLLRQQLDKPFKDAMLHTVYGIGFKLVLPQDKADE